MREEQEAHDAALAAEAEQIDASIVNDPEPDPEGNALFNKDGYIPEPLQLPKIDGEQIDKIGVAFKSSKILLERGEAADVALVRDQKLGSTITLLVECEVGVPTPSFTTSKDGDLDALVLYRELKPVRVYKPVPEQLSELAGA